MINELKVNVSTNIDKEIKKAKELTSLIERANKLICSFGNSKIEVKLDSSGIAKSITAFTVKFFCGNDEKGSCGYIKESEVTEIISEILKNKDVKEIDVIYK